jgi:SAM-dependent methyltransferase
MGLSSSFLQDLIHLKRRGVLDGAGRVVEIGAQQLADNFLNAGELDEVYQLFGRPRIDLGTPVGQENFTEAAPRSTEFWRSLGFEYAALDYNGHLDSFAIDLNREPVPADMRETFDFVVNTGTTEHVANQDNAFRVIHDLTRKGGVMYHQVPASGDLYHGLVNYSPKFFQHMHKQNDYQQWLFRVDDYGGTPVPEITIRAAYLKRNRQPFITPLDVALKFVPLSQRNPLRAIRRTLMPWR